MPPETLSAPGCPPSPLELQHTIRLVHELDSEIAEIEEQIQSPMDRLDSPITSIPGLGFRIAAMILAEVGDFTRFDSPDKLLAHAGMSPSTYQSGQQKLLPAHGKAWLSIFTLRTLQRNQVCLSLGSTFSRLFSPKSGREGKHYNVARFLTLPKVSSPDFLLWRNPEHFTVWQSDYSLLVSRGPQDLCFFLYPF